MVPGTEMIKFYDLLIKSGSFNEAARLSRLSKPSIYRYKHRFKKIGITENSIKPEENFKFSDSNLNLNAYHSYLTNECDLLKNHVVQYGI